MMNDDAKMMKDDAVMTKTSGNFHLVAPLHLQLSHLTMRRPLLLLRSLIVLTTLLVAGVSAQQITNLPGLNYAINFTQYSGYINVNSTTDRNLFYWFVQSQNNAASDPVIFWFQGGPGCSSLFGFFIEHGPFVVNPDQTLSANPYSWNKYANMVYVESPVGVGFSYTGTNDTHVNDNRTMADAYTFITGFLRQYPSFASHDIYISGESYGGHYVPQLAWYALQQSNNPINLKGILVGNPWTDNQIDSAAVVPFLYSHALISYATWRDYQIACNATSIEETYHFRRRFHDFISPAREIPLLNPPENNDCSAATAKAFREVGSQIDQYDIYWPCVPGAGLDCENYSASIAYLNRADVRAALHVSPKVTQKWSTCFNVHYGDSWNTVLNVYPQLMKYMRVTIYSGDVTFNVPFIGTSVWTELLGAPTGVKQDWTSWQVNGQVAGYVKKYNGLNFVTVKNAGHMVPECQPAAGLELLKNYLSGEL